MMRALVAAAAALLVVNAGARAQSPAPAAKPKWFPAPAFFLPGAMLAVVSGDPTKAGRYTILLSMPDGYRMMPHFHPGDEHVEVRQGTLLIGVGDKFDPKKTIALAVGDTGTAPAGAHHYAIAKGPTIIAVTCDFPYTITYLRRSDVPRGTFPYGN